MSENTNTTKRRSAIQIMGSLIGLVPPPAPYHAGSNHPWNIRLLVCDLPDDTGRAGHHAWTSDRGSRNDCSGEQYVVSIYPGKNDYESYDRNCSASWNPTLYGTVL